MTRGWFRSLLAAIGAGSVAMSATLPADVYAFEPYVVFNERQVEGWASSANSRSADEMLKIVWAALPPKLTVYPTENYYYFSIYVDGRTFNGNILLGPDYLDRGVFSFAYKEVSGNDVGGDLISVEAMYSGENGVRIKRLSKLEYEIEFNAKAVVFRINDIDTTRPPIPIAASERYLGRVFDESGAIFFLMYDSIGKVFAFILDDNTPNISLVEAKPSVLLHERSGFVFVQDGVGRKVLAATYRYNEFSNNYYDGPFDQIDYNNYEIFDFRSALIDSNPDLTGRIDQYANYLADPDVKAAITPYSSYVDARTIGDVNGCLEERRDWASIYRCIKTPMVRSVPNPN